MQRSKMENLAYPRRPITTVESLNSATYIPEDRLEHFQKEMAILEAISARKEAEYMNRLHAQATDPFLRGKRVRELQLISQRRSEAKAKKGETNVGKSKPNLSNVAVARLKEIGADLGATSSNGLDFSRNLNVSVDLNSRSNNQTCMSRATGVCSEQTSLVSCNDNPSSGSVGTTVQGQSKVDLNSFANDMNLPQDVVAEIFEKWPHAFDDSVCSQFFRDFEVVTYVPPQDDFSFTLPSSPAMPTEDGWPPSSAAVPSSVQFLPETASRQHTPEWGFGNSGAYGASSFDPLNIPMTLPGQRGAATMPLASGRPSDPSWFDAAPPNVHMPASNGHCYGQLAFDQQPTGTDERNVLPVADYPVASICNEQPPMANCSTSMQNFPPAASLLDRGVRMGAPERTVDCRLDNGGTAQPILFMTNTNQQMYDFLPYNQNSAQYYHNRSFT
ncbi:hypothetical protein M514_03452 [Trichuris suis]|uniref:Uncharacterized protein n=1 Tax=Trichuris suis TaxID=68888 RepID=A0A085NDR4_9BILA|nr:hypothetical protein M513_03452 [Trichuris suis]KFD67610.1 hypothetical protein M514_03452 [Trichuris suis]KHJ48032.1 hypothetical protein D918_01299 [Trichuris suis]